MNATLNGTFVRPPEADDLPPDPSPIRRFDPEVVQSRWARMKRDQRQAFVSSIGVRASVREFGLSVVEVALAWPRPLPLEVKLEHVRMLARD
jgi:hypothetical protein